MKTRHDDRRMRGRQSASLRVAGAYLTLVALGLIASVHVSGCSLINYTVGSVIDATSHKVRLVPTGEVRRFHPGDALTFYMNDSTTVTGIYVRSGRQEAAVYGERYAAWRTTSPDADEMPSPGRTVQLRLIGYSLMARSPDRFVGFTHQGVLLTDGRHWEREVLYSRISHFGVPGARLLSGEELVRLRRSGSLPLMTTIEIQSPPGSRDVLLDDVAFVRAPAEKNAAHTGLVIGLVADALIVVTVVAIAASYSGPFDSSSCSGDYSGVTQGRIPDGLYRRALGEELRAAGADAPQADTTRVDVTGSGIPSGHAVSTP